MHRAAESPIRNGRVDLQLLRSQIPLPDTADELCAVAAALSASQDDILLGRLTTETNLKRLNSQGRLAEYRIIHFATHGVLEGEVEGAEEPVLILTPPERQSDENDGYLSASEIAAFKLDADWVIMSACNTGHLGSERRSQLSVLARAFISAGARALLVSHWAVASKATVKLVTTAVDAITRDASIGRAEALRRSMLAMIDKGAPYEASVLGTVRCGWRSWG